MNPEPGQGVMGSWPRPLQSPLGLILMTCFWLRTLTHVNFNHLNKMEGRYKVLILNVNLSEVLLSRLYVRPFIHCLKRNFYAR